MRRTGCGHPVSRKEEWDGASQLHQEKNGDGLTSGRQIENMHGKRTYRHLAHLPALAANPIVFLTVTAYQRHMILNTAWAHKILHSIWANSAEMNGWYVGDYLLMPDHLHCFVRHGREADSLERWIKMWKSVSARKMAQLCGLKPPIWQADYFDRYLRTSESYAEKWKYVQLNPVRARIVSNADEWPYKGRIYALSM